MATSYKFKPQARLKGDAQAVGEAIEGIRETVGAIVPGEVVNVARQKESILHGYFEWSDKKAGEAFRIDQARHLIRSIIVVQSDDIKLEAPTRAFVAVDLREDDEEPGKSYTSIAEAVRVVDYREQLINDALRDLDAYRMKYHLLADITGWRSAIAHARTNLSRVIEQLNSARESQEAA